MRLPRFHLLYFKDLLDLAFIQFFDKFNDKFVRIGDEYHLGESISLQNIEKCFRNTIDLTLKRLVVPYDTLNSPDFYFIIGACQPKDNYLLKFRRSDFPKKLNALISSKLQLKYILKEKDIKIDTIKFNEACCNIFNHYFLGQSQIKERNLVFLAHKNLDCYSMLKMLKFMFGKANCVNMKKEHFSQTNSPIVAINDLIDKNIHCKAEANKDPKFKKIFKEIQQYVDAFLNEAK